MITCKNKETKTYQKFILFDYYIFIKIKTKTAVHEQFHILKGER